MYSPPIQIPGHKRSYLPALRKIAYSLRSCIFHQHRLRFVFWQSKLVVNVNPLTTNHANLLRQYEELLCTNYTKETVTNPTSRAANHQLSTLANLLHLQIRIDLQFSRPPNFRSLFLQVYLCMRASEYACVSACACERHMWLRIYVHGSICRYVRINEY